MLAALTARRILRAALLGVALFAGSLLIAALLTGLTARGILGTALLCVALLVSSLLRITLLRITLLGAALLGTALLRSALLCSALLCAALLLIVRVRIGRLAVPLCRQAEIFRNRGRVRRAELLQLILGVPVAAVLGTVHITVLHDRRRDIQFGTEADQKITVHPRSVKILGKGAFLSADTDGRNPEFPQFLQRVRGKQNLPVMYGRLLADKRHCAVSFAVISVKMDAEQNVRAVVAGIPRTVFNVVVRVLGVEFIVAVSRHINDNIVVIGLEISLAVLRNLQIDRLLVRSVIRRAGKYAAVPCVKHYHIDAVAVAVRAVCPGRLLIHRNNEKRHLHCGLRHFGAEFGRALLHIAFVLYAVDRRTDTVPRLMEQIGAGVKDLNLRSDCHFDNALSGTSGLLTQIINHPDHAVLRFLIGSLIITVNGKVHRARLRRSLYRS